MRRSAAALVACLALASPVRADAYPGAAPDAVLTPEAFQSDDACLGTGEAAGCALSALQKHVAAPDEPGHVQHSLLSTHEVQQAGEQPDANPNGKQRKRRGNKRNPKPSGEPPADGTAPSPAGGFDWTKHFPTDWTKHFPTGAPKADGSAPSPAGGFDWTKFWPSGAPAADGSAPSPAGGFDWTKHFPSGAPPADGTAPSPAGGFDWTKHFPTDWTKHFPTGAPPADGSAPSPAGGFDWTKHFPADWTKHFPAGAPAPGAGL